MNSTKIDREALAGLISNTLFFANDHEDDILETSLFRAASLADLLMVAAVERNEHGAALPPDGVSVLADLIRRHVELGRALVSRQYQERAAMNEHIKDLEQGEAPKTRTTRKDGAIYFDPPMDRDELPDGMQASAINEAGKVLAAVRFGRGAVRSEGRMPA